MSYKSILVHADGAEAAQNRYRLAALIAQAHRAHLTGIATSGLTPFFLRYAAATAMAPLAAEDFSFLTDNAKDNLAIFERGVRQAGVQAPTITLSEQEAWQELPLAARYCDLLVIGRNHASDSLIGDSQSLARSLLVHAPCPVLVVPDAAPAVTAPSRILIAWDGGMEASRALRAALPLLRHAAGVAAATFNPAIALTATDAAATPLAALSRYLGHHGIAVDALPQADSVNVGRSLLALAERHGIDLIVMGSYTHSRVREVVLGGVTRTMLAESDIALLMSH